MDKIAIGKIRTSTGISGYFKVLSFSGEVVHFKKLKGQSIEIRLKSRIKELQIEDVKMSGSNITMKAAGIDTPEDAKKMSGWDIYVVRENASACSEDEYYLADLCRCSLLLDGQIVGQVKAVSSNGVSDLLEVDVDGKTRLIPFLNQFVGRVDLEAETVELKEGWLLE